jgi:hypothetical protein
VSAQAETEPAPEPVAAEPAVVPGLRATLTSEPTSVEVGEPMVWTLEVHHPRDLVPRLPGEDLGLGPHWVVLEELGVTAAPSPDGEEHPDFWITRKRWKVIGLTTADRLPSMEVSFGEGEGAPSVLTSEGELEVRTVLGAGEQFSRAGKGFRDVDELASSGSAPPWWVVAPAVTLVLGLAWWLFRRRRGAAKEPEPATPLERLASLEASLPDDLAALQALHYSLTSLVRAATERRLGKSFGGATDEEWLERVRVDGRLLDGVEAKLERVFRDAESVKYARRKPTRWAVEETLQAARGALEEVAEPAGGAR